MIWDGLIWCGQKRDRTLLLKTTLLRPGDDLILQSFPQIAEIIAVPGHAHAQRATCAQVVMVCSKPQGQAAQTAVHLAEL
jgi:hypothetical protein